MTSHCIVGIDGSDVATDALRWAVRNAGAHSRVVALNVWHLPVALKVTMAKRSLDADRLGLAAEAAHEIDTAIEALDHEAALVEPSVVEGHPSPTLVAEASAASMLVVGRRGASRLAELVLGSTSNYCATHATVPTVVVPPGFDRPRARSVVVGFDGSENASAGLRWALDFFDESATIRIIAAIDLSPWLDVESTLNRFPEEVANEERRIVAAIDAVDPERRGTREIMLHGPKQALAAASASADIVVLGARGHGAIGAAMLGSIATWMLHGSTCPVAIVPADA